MAERSRFVVIGAGMAGALAAQALRDEGFAGRVVLLGDEPVRPYDRVPLSKQYLRGEPGGHGLFVHDEAYYADRDIELRLDTVVTAVDCAARRVLLASKEEIGYDRLLFATGAEVRRLHLPGAELDGVHYLRSMADADRLRAALRAAGRVVVIGAGWIGCEVAASARELGCEVALVDVEGLPLQRALGAELAAFYRDVHAAHGVELHLGTAVEELRGAARVEQVVLAGGRLLAADVVVVGIGVRPRDGLADAAGIGVDNGIVTDEFLQAGTPGVFAAGDVAGAWHPLLDRRVRLEHWSSALNQGPVAARNMLGQKCAYDRLPFFFSDQYDVWMEYNGDATDADRLVVRGDIADARFIAFWLRQGRLVAGMNVGIRDVADTIATLIASGQRYDGAALADPAIDLSALVRVG